MRLSLPQPQAWGGMGGLQFLLALLAHFQSPGKASPLPKHRSRTTLGLPFPASLGHRHGPQPTEGQRPTAPGDGAEFRETARRSPYAPQPPGPSSPSCPHPAPFPEPARVEGNLLADQRTSPRAPQLEETFPHLGSPLNQDGHSHGPVSTPRSVLPCSVLTAPYPWAWLRLPLAETEHC